MTGPPGHQARPSPPIGQARSPAGQAVQARSAGPARCRWRPIKGRRLGFGDPNRPLCQAAAAVRYSGRRRRHPPSSPSHRRCQATAAAPSFLYAASSTIPLLSLLLYGELKAQPWRPAGGAKPPVPGELQSRGPSLRAGAQRIRPRRPSRWRFKGEEPPPQRSRERRIRRLVPAPAGGCPCAADWPPRRRRKGVPAVGEEEGERRRSRRCSWAATQRPQHWGWRGRHGM